MGKDPGLARGLSWGDVRLVAFGAPDKTRPALILTRSRIIGRLNAVTIVPITRTARGGPTEIALGTESGLKTHSTANFDSVQTVSKTRVGRFLGSIDSRRKPEISAALLQAFELDRE